ncbi:MAG: hypothetical protein ACFFC7_26490, partial [Candidatus Hermodarchaeota archaeon]
GWEPKKLSMEQINLDIFGTQLTVRNRILNPCKCRIRQLIFGGDVSSVTGLPLIFYKTDEHEDMPFLDA